MAVLWQHLLRVIAIVLSVAYAGGSLAQTTDESDADASASPVTIEVTPPDAAVLATVADAAAISPIPGIDMAAWQQLAVRAERALDNDRISSDSFEVLRALLADYRAEFLAAQDTNAGRIATIRTQIEALGAPDDGIDDTPSVAARRAALEAQLSELRAPVIAAEEAHTQANGLITEIDQVIRTRQAARLTEVGPSPLNPVHWGPAWRDLTAAFGRLKREVAANLENQVRRNQILRSSPAAAFFLLLGLVLLVLGRRWSRRASDWVITYRAERARLWSSVLALGQFLLPLIGMIAVVAALSTLKLFDTRGEILLQSVVPWATIILGARWLGDRLFARHDGARILPLSTLNQREAHTYTTTLAVLFVLHLFTLQIAALNGFSEDTLSVVSFPLLVVAALMLYRFGHLLARRIAVETEDPDERVPMRIRYVSTLGRAARIIAVVSPILAAAGYGQGARALMYPAIATLGLAGLLIVLQRFTSELYRYLTRQAEDEEDSLTAVLIAFALVLAALPVLALIWGARVADLTELWTRFGEGFAIGGARFRPTDIMVVILVFAVLYSATRLLQGALRNTVLPKTSLDTGGRNAVVSGVGYIGVALAAVLSISAAGIDLSALAFIFTALSVGIGFGLQNIVQNFVSGIILLIERPIAEGDWIEVNGNMGYVRNISVRSTRIETFDRTDVIVPNGDLISGTVTNYTRGNSIGRVIVPVGVAYGSDVQQVESILVNIARAHDMVLMNPPPSVIFQGFGADSLDFEIRAILRDVNYVLSVKSEMNHQIYAAFAEAGIEIPFAQRDVWLRNPEALTGETPTAAATDAAKVGEPSAATHSKSPRLSDRDLGEESAFDPTQKDTDFDLGGDDGDSR